jgi:hypothetical protein
MLHCTYAKFTVQAFTIVPAIAAMTTGAVATRLSML